MIRHRRRPTRALGATAFAAVALLVPLLLPAPARAQSTQIAINTAFVANVDNTGAGGCQGGGVPTRFLCPISTEPVEGVISNDPEIQFSSAAIDRCNITNGSELNLVQPNPEIPGTLGMNVCNDRVYLCAQVMITDSGLTSATSPETIQIDELEFEVFRYVDGANPLDPSSTPPLATFFIDNPGNVTLYNYSQTDYKLTDYVPNDSDAYCVIWDAEQPVQGQFGKINGQYGFRTTVQTNEVGESGNITLTQVRAYPSGATGDAYGATVSQKPITVDVTDVHVINSTPTLVGKITPVAAEPYNFTYRLSKDATMYITINQSLPPYNEVRQVVPGLPRTGEGTLATSKTAPLLNGDSWDGRDDDGDLLPAGSYLAVFQANSADQYTRIGGGEVGDLSLPTTVQIGLDPLQITDIQVQPLLGGSTSLAVLSYQLTEPATVYVDIYPPGTQFCSGLNDVTDAANGPPSFPAAKNFSASSSGCASPTYVSPLRVMSQQQTFRQPVITYWDGRDSDGNLLSDGDYVFAMYASLPSQAGAEYLTSADKRIWTSTAKVGFISVLRGLVGITQVTPVSTVIGSSPAIAGLNPFTFRYELSRDANVSLKIYDASGTKLIKTLVDNESRPGLFNNVETWADGTGDNGLTVDSGTYLVQLTADDPNFPSKVSTTTALFPVDLFRVTDVTQTPLLSGASDQVTLSYQLSQPMYVAWNIYPAGSVVNSTTTWPPCPTQSPPAACTSPNILTPTNAQAVPVVTFQGLRPGRLKITEYWDGRDGNGLFVPDGSYEFTLVAQSTSSPPTFATDKVFGSLTVARGSIIFNSFNVTPDVPQLFNSSNTITLDPYTIGFTLSRQSSVTVQILDTNIPPDVVRTIVSGQVLDSGILQNEIWDGRDDLGNFPPSGFYLVRAIATDVASVLTPPSTAELTISYDPLRIYDLAVAPLTNGSGGAAIDYQVSEPMKVAIKIYKPNTGFDSVGNPTTPDSQSLVRRIVGIRPARTPIQDIWDGRDSRLALVPDGIYKFKIVGSTDPKAIDDVTGDILIPSELAEDRLIDDIPVAVNASLNPTADFEGNTFSYPNPLGEGDSQACFHVYNPFDQAHILLKLYNMAGDLVVTHDFGNVTGSFNSPSIEGASPCSDPGEWLWHKTNDSGRTVARGLYYAVIRVEETEGGANVLQTVKKVLVK
jgi:flagellar hook assembly protein FlgD